jgi:hypothetical protein
MKNYFLKTAIAISFVISLTFLSCKKESDKTLPTEPVQINLSTNQVSLIESANSFSFDESSESERINA